MLNQQRVITFFKIYEMYKDIFVFVIVDTDELEDVFPHIYNQTSRFSLFNFLYIDKSSSKIGKYYPHLIYPYEKYFLQDEKNYLEKPEALAEKIEQLLKIPRTQRKINHTVVVKDNIQQINSEFFRNIMTNSETPIIIQLESNQTDELIH